MNLTLGFADSAALAAAKRDVTTLGALSVPLNGAAPPELFVRVTVAVTVASKAHGTVDGQVVQLLPGGLAVVLVDEAARASFGEAATDESAPLWSRIGEMGKAEKMQLAKHGNADARRLLLKDVDPVLHLHVLQNPGITAGEVAGLITGGAASISFLKAVLTRSDLVANPQVMEALVMSPHTPLNDAIRLVDRVPLEVAKRIAKTGKGRGPVLHAAKKRVTR